MSHVFCQANFDDSPESKRHQDGNDAKCVCLPTVVVMIEIQEDPSQRIYITLKDLEAGLP